MLLAICNILVHSSMELHDLDFPPNCDFLFQLASLDDEMHESRAIRISEVP